MNFIFSLFLVGCVYLISIPSGYANDMNNTSKGIRIFIDTSDNAIAYYTRIQGVLKGAKIFSPNDPKKLILTLDDLIKYFGVSLSAKNLEELPPADLMTKEPTKILSSRFFAPKIVDYSKTEIDAAAKFDVGWRKLVHISADANSDAFKDGMKSVSILFNYIQPLANVAKDPFDGQQSKNNQVIIVPANRNPATEDSAYFMVFDKKDANYPLITALQGVAFDLPSLGLGGNYFVPGSCAQCHGDEGGAGGAIGPFKTVRLNYLDTDHWMDAAGYDFKDFLANSTNGILFDAPRDTTSAEFKKAFDVVRKLNAEIVLQNLDARKSLLDPIEKDYKTRAALKWQELHKNNDQFLPIDDRVLRVAGQKQWDLSINEHRLLLQNLNRYCFRCHSSIAYNVFDKSTIKLARVKSYIGLPISSEIRMPQGRVLPQALIDEMRALADAANK